MIAPCVAAALFVAIPALFFALMLPADYLQACLPDTQDCPDEYHPSDHMEVKL